MKQSKIFNQSQSTLKAFCIFITNSLAILLNSQTLLSCYIFNTYVMILRPF
jgi:hypothetical protein